MSDLREQLHGLWLPLVTPFRGGELDETSLRRLVRHYASLPVDGFILAATSGEGMSLSMGELERLVALTRTEISAGPRYIPILLGLSNIPYRTAVGIDNDTLLQLAAHPNIVGMKDCCANREQTIDLLRRRPAGFRVLTGEDAQYHNALLDGADGAILLSAHVETEAFAAVRTLLREGNQEGAEAQWRKVAELTRLLFTEPSPSPAKHWLWRSGQIDSPEVRLPMVEVSHELAAVIDREIERRAPPLLRRA